MIRSILGALVALAAVVPSSAAQGSARDQEIVTLSKTKWRWMSERKVDSLAALFHDEAVFVHMGGTMSKTQELDVIRGGMIQYKTAEIQEASVRFINLRGLVLNHSPSDDVELLSLGHRPSHMDKDGFVVEESGQGIDFALRHPAPLRLG